MTEEISQVRSNKNKATWKRNSKTLTTKLTQMLPLLELLLLLMLLLLASAATTASTEAEGIARPAALSAEAAAASVGRMLTCLIWF